MSLSFLLLSNVLLLTRLFSLFRDDPVPGRTWMISASVQLGALGILCPFSRMWLAAAIVLVASNLLGWLGDRRSRRRNLLRLVVGLGTLLLLSFCFAPYDGLGIQPEWREFAPVFGSLTAFSMLARAAFEHGAQVLLFGLLLVANEANLAIRAVFESLDLKPRTVAAAGGGGIVDIGEFNRGRIIGILERVLLFLFLLQGQYGAIGFVLAAKAFTRFKALDDRAFAEYVLIGTLLSACLALVVAGGVRLL
jgi:hypothetical protein